MTKLTFDVDFSEDPEKILKQIQDRAKAEVEKRESKDKVSAYLSKLHEKVNEDISSEYKSTTDLIKALTPFASPALKDKLSSTSASGRRKTISMDKATFDKIKELLTESNPNKAAIGRETGVSVVQVRKVASGGYDKKFEGDDSTVVTKKEEASAPEAPSFEDETPAPPEPAPDLPEPPSFEDETPAPPEPAPDLPEPPSFGDETPAPPEPAPDLPEPPSFGDEPPAPPEPAPDLPKPPSFGDETPAPPAPSPISDEPPAPPAPPSPMSGGPPSPPAPPSPVSGGTPTPPSGNPGLTRPPGLGGKPSLKSGKPGKPTLSLKSGKSKTKGLKITRPPQPPPA